MLRSRLLALALPLLLACGADPGAPAPDASDLALQMDTGDTPTDATSDAAPPDDTAEPQPPGDLAALVDPFVGTGATLLNFGALYPGAHLPFGLVALSPDTDGFISADQGVAHAGGYLCQDTEVRGFSHLHLAGTGVADYGLVAVVPAVGDPVTLLAHGDPPNLPLDHARESAAPGDYRLATDAVSVELTATRRAGLHRYTFAPTADALLALDATHALGKGRAADSALTVDPVTGEIAGFVHHVGDFSGRFGGFTLHFVAVPSRPPRAVGTWDAGGYVPGRLATAGTRAGAALAFDATADPVVELRVGLSFVDGAGARANLAAEALALPFDAACAAARAAWNDALGAVLVTGGTPERQRLFYTALYHAHFMPTLLTDVDGRYRGLDAEVHAADGFTYYSDFSLWDTYRTFHPLMSLIAPHHQRDFLASLVAMARDGGSMPVWPLAIGETGSMIGTSADAVFGDALGKGFDNLDWAAAYAAMRALATAPAPAGRPGRDDFEVWQAHGYVPSDLASGSVSKTLEYAHDDFCLGRVAAALGHGEDAALFAARARWWEAHRDPSGPFLAPRLADGRFPPYETEKVIPPYIEGSAWQYLFMVPHDVPGLVSFLGGPAGFADRLETFLARGAEAFRWDIPSAMYTQANEPDLLAPWLFGFGGRPERTRYWTTWVADHMYALASWGLAGNDDGGTLSAWYVFAGLGLYPLTCTGEYALSTPLFDRVVVRRAGGDLTVRRAAGATRLDGVEIVGPTITHAALAAGQRLELPPPEREEPR